MVDFCHTTRDEKSLDIREYMLDYVMHQLEDAVDFSLAAAKASHAFLLRRIEQNEIASWKEVDKIDRVRHAHTQIHVPQQVTRSGQNKLNSNKFALCVYFVFSQKQSHETKGVLCKHVYAPCLAAEGKAYDHAQVDCRKA